MENVNNVYQTSRAARDESFDLNKDAKTSHGGLTKTNKHKELGINKDSLQD